MVGFFSSLLFRFRSVDSRYVNLISDNSFIYIYIHNLQGPE